MSPNITFIGSVTLTSSNETGVVVNRSRETPGAAVSGNLVDLDFQGLKVFDNSVENLASGAWQALGSAWKGGTNLVQKLEHSAANIADSIQHGGLPAGSVAPSLIETGKAFTTKGMQVLEYVGKETMDLLITETGIEVEKNPKGGTEQPSDEDQLFEEVSFDRCFYIYGGPEQLEELEALSSHYALLFNRRKTKLPSEQKSIYEGKLKKIQQIFSLDSEMDGNGPESAKGKKIETGTEGSHDEMKSLHDSSVSKAADMAAGFTNALAGLAVNDIIQRTTGRLESLHSEGVHRLSEMCCFAVSQLLMLGKSVITSANKVQDEDPDGDMMNIDWPEDSVEKAKSIRVKAQSMTGYVEAVSSSFITGISDVAEAYLAAIKSATSDSHEALPQASIQEKANSFSEHLRGDQTTAVSKILDGLHSYHTVKRAKEEIDPAFIQATEHRPKLDTIEVEGIPLTDLSVSDTRDIKELVSEIGNACKKWGFFQVINHGVPLELCTRIRKAAKTFFDQPIAKKRKAKRDEVNAMGYHDSEHTECWRPEGDPTFHPASPEPEDKEIRTLTNQWPENPPEFRNEQTYDCSIGELDSLQEYAREVEKLGYKLLELISLSLGLPSNRLNGYLKDHSGMLRLNYYPPCPCPDLAFGVGRHKC
ncbi:hypothetical protein CRYUN_Cryun10bG0125000 [Craigia yunnanensis]